MLYFFITSTILFIAVLIFLIKLRFKKLALVFTGIIVLYIFLSVSVLYILNGSNNFKGETVIKIEHGMSFNYIAEKLKSEGIIDSKLSFKLSGYLLNLEKGLKAGKYKFTSGLSNFEILKKLKSCDYVVEKVTIPEGLTIKEIAGILKKSLEIDEKKFIDLCFDKDFISGFNLEYNSLEGFLFPDTYFIAWGTPEENIIKILVEQFNTVFERISKSSDYLSKYGKLDIITMASIVEGEAMIDEEKAVIAGVFFNRLRKKIRLNADPTIQYIIPDGPRRLLNGDLKIDSPYNTYLYYGLPPGPICNPGETSIKAALFPDDNNYLYFVAKGDGKHTFSRTMQEHLKAKRKFDRFRREVRRAQKNAKRN